MTTNTFDTEESNSNINSPQYFVDDDGSLKFISPVLSSSNFDGSVPVFEGQIPASEISPGKFIKTGEEYFPVISVAYDDQELEESPSNEIAVTYLDSNSEVQEIIYNLTDDVDVKYENWEEKYLGTQGWSLTYGGNAIFANVGVRGDLEATTLDVGGANGITYDGSTVIIGASVVINAPLNIGDLSASYTTFDFITASYADINDLKIPGQTIIDGGNITTGVINASLITTGALSGWTIDTNKIYTSQMTFDSANSRISVGPTNSPIGVLEKDIAGTGITLRCDSTTTAYGGTLPLARIDVTDAGSTAYGGVKLQALEFFGRGGGATIELNAVYPTAYCNISAPFVNIESTFGTNLKYGFRVTNGAGTTVAECSSTGVFTGDGSGLTNLPSGGSSPTGTIVMYGGGSAPSGWLLCDGAAVSRSTYSALWNVLGSSYGNGNGSTTFNVPNFISGGPGGAPAFPRGGNTRGNTGGQDSFTIAEANLPNHNHGVGTLTIGGTSGGSGALSHSGTVDSKGGHTHSSLTATTATEASHRHGVGDYVIGGSVGSGGSHSHTYTAPDAAVTGRSGTGNQNVVPNRTTGTATSNEPSHQHGAGTLAISGQSALSGSHSHAVSFDWTNATAGSHQHTVTINDHASHTHGAGTLALSGNTGNWGTATPSSINNQPPYLVVNFIIKT